MKKETKSDDKQASHKVSSTLDEWIGSELERCRRAFETGNIGAIEDVLYYCGRHQKPLPQWAYIKLLNITRDFIFRAQQNKKGRNARWITQHRQDIIDFTRAECVQECRTHGFKWHGDKNTSSVYEKTSDLLKGTFAEGSEHAIKKSYERYKKRSKENPLRYKILSGLPVKSLR